MSYQFQGQRSNEEVVLFTKQHPFVLLHPFLVVIGIWLLPMLFYVVSSNNSLLSIVLFFSLVIGFAYGALAYFRWKNSVLLLTTERIVFLMQRGIVHREFTECSLVNVQQVAHEVKGFFSTIFGYGDISIYTGGAQQPLRIPHMPDPYEIQQEFQRAGAGEGFVEE